MLSISRINQWVDFPPGLSSVGAVHVPINANKHESIAYTIGDISFLVSKTSLRPVGLPWAVRSKIILTKESVCPATGGFSKGGKSNCRSHCNFIWYKSGILHDHILICTVKSLLVPPQPENLASLSMKIGLIYEPHHEAWQVTENRVHGFHNSGTPGHKHFTSATGIFT